MSPLRYLAEVFDANFDRLVTRPTVSILYILGLAVITGVVGCGTAGALWLINESAEPVVPILGPVIVLTVASGLFLLGTFLCRLTCELLIVLFTLGQNSTTLVHLASESRTEGHAHARPAA